jgi:small-conductance mechanosensitive channel
VTTATTVASQILSNTLAVLKTVRERAKLSKDADLKNQISELYDSVLSLKEAVMLVNDENTQLRARITELERPPNKPEIRQMGLTNYYYVGEKGPYCQPCFDVNGKLIPLAPQNRYAGGIGRKCEVCNKVFFENNEMMQERIEPYGSWR